MSQKEQAEFEELKELLEQFQEALARQEIIHFSEDEFEEIIYYYLKNNQPQNALDASLMALQRFPFSSEFCLTQADAHVELGDLDAAEALLVDNFKIDKSDIDFYMILSEVYLLRNNYEKAILLCKEGLNVCEVDRDILLLHLAEIYDYQGEYREVISVLEDCLELNSENEDALYLYSVTMSILDRVEEKVEYLQSNIDDNPFNINAWYYLGMSYKELELYERAIEAFEYIAALEEDNNDIVSDMAQVYLEADNPQRAIEILKEVERKGILHQIDHYTLGYAYHQTGELYLAKYHFKEALSFEDIADEAYYQLARIYFEEEKYHAALPLVQKALDKSADYVHYLELKADILYELDEMSECLEIYERIIQMTNSLPHYLCKLASITSVHYGLEAAMEILDRGIEEHSHYALYYHKAMLYYIHDHWADLYIEFGKGLMRDYESHDIVFEKFPELEKDPNIQILLSQYSE